MDKLNNKAKWYRGDQREGWRLSDYDHPQLGEVTGFIEADEGDPFWDEDSGLEYLKDPLTRREIAEDTLGEREFNRLKNQTSGDKHPSLWKDIAKKHEKKYAMGTMFGPEDN